MGKIDELAQRPELLDALSPREFEELVADLLSKFGWQVKLTPPTRDGGFDILGISRDPCGFEVSWIIECKRYAADNLVGIELVRQLHGVKEHLGISNAAIVTTASFTGTAVSFARLRYDIKLADRSWIIDWLKRQTASVGPSMFSQPAPFQSCFISHSHRDHDFAELLTLKLRETGIRTWFAPDDLVAGKKIYEEIRNAIEAFDKLIIVLSKHSMNSEWVHTEISRARRRELAERVRVLFPVSLVPMAELRKWECFDADTGKDFSRELREYYIPVFDNWRDSTHFDEQFAKILSGLRK